MKGMLEREGINMTFSNATCNDAGEVVAGRVMGHAVMRSVFTEGSSHTEKSG